MTDLATIEQRCAQYSHWHDALQSLLSELEAEVHAVKRKRMNTIKAAMRKAAFAHGLLKEAIESSPQLWKKPRTRVFHGVKVGLKKGKGKITWTDPTRVVQRIKELYQDDLGILIKTIETPVKEALENLSVSDLKKLGVSIVEAHDQTVIRMVDSEVERMVNALLKDDLEEAVEEEAA